LITDHTGRSPGRQRLAEADDPQGERPCAFLEFFPFVAHSPISEQNAERGLQIAESRPNVPVHPLSFPPLPFIPHSAFRNPQF
jgi:hypothetical protein